jgi:uncharacterized membrane protein YjjP (DUF1212 family)
MSTRRLPTELLARAGGLLLEYNESTRTIERVLAMTAEALTGEGCRVAVSYSGVAVSLGGESPLLERVHEIHYNTAVQARVRKILEEVRRGELEPAAALACLDRVEADTPRHSRGVAVLVLGVAAACLARLLGSDAAAAVVAGIATALGLFARQELGRRHVGLLALPFAAALIGAVLGGLAIRLGWTRTPGLVLIVPSLMLVPGPHLINALFDLIDNHVPMSIARLGLATGILLASALGIVVGIKLALPGPVVGGPGTRLTQLDIISDMILAGVVTCGFAVFYNTPWPQVALAALGGMAGHGLRFFALDAGLRPEVATFLGGLAVGVVAAWITRAGRTPVAVIAFAGAVTMMPGLQIYRALGGALELARLADMTDAAGMAETLGNALQACLVIGGLALGLVFGARVVLAAVGMRG